MPRKNPDVEETDDKDLEVGKPKEWAAGIPGVLHSMQPAIKHMGLSRTEKTLLALNQKDGFDCMSCAWPDPDHRKRLSSARTAPRPSPGRPRRWCTLGILGGALRQRTARAVRVLARACRAGSRSRSTSRRARTTTSPVSWDEAFRSSAEKLKGLDRPDQAAFYTSGRTSNEAAFLYQLFVRGFGTNNLPDCSNMCHESSGWAMGQTIGIGKATVSYDDFAKADLIIIMGQNPGTNHPRMLTALEDAKRGGGRDRRRQPAARSRAAAVQEPAEGQGHHRPRHPDRRPVPADPDRRRHGAAAGRLQARARRRGQEPGHRAGPRSSSRNTARGSRSSGRTSPGWTRQAVLEATGPAQRRDRRAGRPVSARPTRVIITWAMGHHPAEEGVSPPSRRSSTCCCCAATSASRAPAPPRSAGTATCRATGPWASGSRCRQPSWTRSARSSASTRRASTARTPWRRSAGCATARIKVFVALGGNLVAAISDTARRRGGDGEHRADRADLDQAEPLAHRDGRGGADPAHAWAAPRSTCRSPVRSSSPWRTPFAPCTRLAGRVEPVSRRTCSPRWPSSAGSRGQTLAGTVQRRLGRVREELRPHPGPHLPRGGRLRGLQRARSGRKAASSCPTARGTPAPSPRRPARPC